MSEDTPGNLDVVLVLDVDLDLVFDLVFDLDLDLDFDLDRTLYPSVEDQIQVEV